MTNKTGNYPRCKYHLDGRITIVKNEADEDPTDPECDPADVPPPPPAPAEGCRNCLALAADAEAKMLKFDASWIELTDANRKLIEHNTELRTEIAAHAKVSEVNVKLAAELAELRAQFASLSEANGKLVNETVELRGQIASAAAEKPIKRK